MARRTAVQHPPHRPARLTCASRTFAARPSSLVREYFGNLVFTNTFYQEGANVAKASHDAGLVTGYLHGRALRQNQRTIFWHDLGYRMGDQSYRGPQSQWSSQDWSFWYTDAAGYFRRYHLTA
jgi:hypothetical protein